MICIPLRQKQNLAPTTLLNIISIIKTQNAHYRVDNLYQKFKYLHIWAPTAPNIFALWVWGGTRASLRLKNYRVQNLNKKVTYLHIWAPLAPNILVLWVWGGTKVIFG